MVLFLMDISVCRCCIWPLLAIRISEYHLSILILSSFRGHKDIFIAKICIAYLTKAATAVNPIESDVYFERLRTGGVLFAIPFYHKNQRVSILSKPMFCSVKVASPSFKPEIQVRFLGRTVLGFFS